MSAHSLKAWLVLGLLLVFCLIGRECLEKHRRQCVRCIFVPTNTDIAVKTEIKPIWKTDMEASSFPELSSPYFSVNIKA